MRPPHALKGRTKLAILLVTLSASALAETLEARARDQFKASAEIGKAYRIQASVGFSARCSGCDESSLGPIEDAVLTLALTPDLGAAGRRYEFMISAGDTFVSPASGSVEPVNARPPERLEREYRDRCSEPTPSLRSFALEPEPP